MSTKNKTPKPPEGYSTAEGDPFFERDPLQNRPRVKAGGFIQSIVRLQGGGAWMGCVYQVKYVSSDGTPIVRPRYAKVDRPVNEWVSIPKKKARK
jgi:hypothetical protein